MSKRVLLTGFEPFSDHKVNPSELLVRSFEGRVIAGRAVAVRVFPTETRALRDRLEAAVRDEQPAMIVGTGFAPRRAALSVERVAVNVLDFENPDAVGTMRKNDPVTRGGPDARLATLPLADIIEAWNANAVPGYVSNSAGTFLCNQWLYEALALTSNAAPPIPVAFVHVPPLPSQAVELGAERTPSMTLELMQKGLERLVETVLTWLERAPAVPSTPGSNKMWIPRGIREVER